MIQGLLFPLLSVLFVAEFFSDMILALKIFVLLTIISWVVMHLGKGPLAIALIVGLSWFILFDAFWFFGGVYVLMTLLMLGFAGIFIDLFFVFPGFASSIGPNGPAEAKMSSQGGVNQRMKMFHKAPGGRKLPPPM